MLILLLDFDYLLLELRILFRRLGKLHREARCLFLLLIQLILSFLEGLRLFRVFLLFFMDSLFFFFE